jgi:hypothetical protein
MPAPVATVAFDGAMLAIADAEGSVQMLKVGSADEPQQVLVGTNTLEPRETLTHLWLRGDRLARLYAGPPKLGMPFGVDRAVLSQLPARAETEIALQGAGACGELLTADGLTVLAHSAPPRLWRLSRDGARVLSSLDLPLDKAFCFAESRSFEAVTGMKNGRSVVAIHASNVWHTIEIANGQACLSVAVNDDGVAVGYPAAALVSGARDECNAGVVLLITMGTGKPKVVARIIGADHEKLGLFGRALAMTADTLFIGSAGSSWWMNQEGPGPQVYSYPLTGLLSRAAH